MTAIGIAFAVICLASLAILGVAAHRAPIIHYYDEENYLNIEMTKSNRTDTGKAVFTESDIRRANELKASGRALRAHYQYQMEALRAHYQDQMEALMADCCELYNVPDDGSDDAELARSLVECDNVDELRVFIELNCAR